LISGFYNYQSFSISKLIAANCFSIFVSFCVWNGGCWIIYKFRFRLQKNPFFQIFLLCVLTTLYAAISATSLCYLWLFFTTRGGTDWQIILKNTEVVSITVVMFTLIYEILFLSSEKEIEYTKSRQLDTALTKAQLTILKNELDPHFMYNALNTLSYLVKKDVEKSEDFIARLSEVYRYFLANKNKEYVTLQEELNFIDQYFFLLQLRYEDKIKLKKELANHDLNAITILPCALQILVENAIKHNNFSETQPLSIKISINEENILVVNTKSPTKIPHYSTKVGLSNLKARYELACNKAIKVESGRNYFAVRLPLLKSA